MSFRHIFILLTITLSAANFTVSSSENTKTASNKGSKEEKIKYITFVDQSRGNEMNKVALINHLHPIATKLASMTYVLPDHILQMLNVIFEGITSVLFGPHTDVFWPLFTNALLVFIKFLM